MSKEIAKPPQNIEVKSLFITNIWEGNRNFTRSKSSNNRLKYVHPVPCLTGIYEPWHYSFMLRKSFLVLLWFPLTLVLLLINLSFLATMRGTMATTDILSTTPLAEGYQITASAGSGQVLGANIIPGDARGLLLEAFLQRHDSPLAPHADLIVQEADKNGIDFRLVVAIAMCESNLGKRVPSRDSHNAWGIAVYTGTQSGAKFDNWPEAIRWVSNYIREKYYNRGLIDLKDVGAVWAPPSVEKGYSWTNCVENFQDSIL